MKYEFKLIHAILGDLIISQPGGWKETKLSLKRHKSFGSLVEYFGEANEDAEDSNAGDFTFYGDNGVINGGIDRIREVIRLYGPDDDLLIRIRLSLNNFTYTTVFEGQLALWGAKFLPNNKVQIPIIRNNFWTKFTNRLDTPVDIQSLTNLDGEYCNILPETTINLTPQILDERSETIQKKVVNIGNMYPLWDPITYSPTSNTDIANNQRIQLNLDNVILNEIAENFASPIAILATNERPAALFGFEYGGVYDFEIKISLTFLLFSTDTDVFPFPLSPAIPSDNDILYWPLSGLAPGTGIDYRMYIQFDNDPPIELTRVDKFITFLTPLILDLQTNYWTEYTFTGSNTFTPGGTVRLWLQNGDSPNQESIYLYDTAKFQQKQPYILGSESNLLMQDIIETYYPASFVPGATISLLKDFNYPNPGVESFINILGHTIHETSEAPVFLAHDAAGQITDRIIGQDDTFYSEFLGSDKTLYRQYDADGCGWRYILAKGLHFRGYSLFEKAFFLSFREWWNGLNPILSLGLCYEIVNGVEVIRVEKLEDYYDKSAVSMNISNVTMSFSYDETVTFKTIKNGYSTGKSENISGIDDFQKETRASRLQKAGQDLTDESGFIAASYAVETTRRTTRKKSADYKFDDNTFIIAVNPVEVSSTIYEPELDENFESITNLLNSSTRYNSILTPARNFFRRIKMYSIGLQDYITSFFKFTGGEGNYDMTSDYGLSDGCQEIIDVAENQDIQVTEALHRNELYEMIVPMQWEEYLLIRNNPKRAIGISQTTTNHVKMFIRDLGFEPWKSKATINAWTTERLEIQVIKTDILGKPCDAVVTECENAYLTEDGFELITEDGNCLILE